VTTTPRPEAPPLGGRSFGDVLRAAQEGCPDAFRLLYEEHQRHIFRYAFARLGRREDAEEVTSEVFLTMLRLLPRYVGDSPAAFRAWLLKIARSRTVDLFRYRGRHPADALEDQMHEVSNLEAGDHPEELAERNAQRAAILSAIARLTPDQQEAVRLRFLVGCGHAEIALVLGRSRGAVNALLHRAMVSLRRILESDPELRAWLDVA
jgi:RNA polymerase sigma-70 factor (ECF subfamily)